MKQHQYIRAICMICLWLSGGLSLPVFGQTTITTAVYYDTIRDDSDPEMTGYEMTIPIGIAHNREHLSLSLETAYSSLHVETDNIASELSAFTDMLFSASYTSTFPRLPLGFILGIDVNIPIGKERLNEEETDLELGEGNDLFRVDNFGEGLNVGASMGVMGQFGKCVLAFQGAYVVNGEYDPTSDTSDDDLDPGNQVLLLGFLQWQASSQLTFGTFLSYSLFSEDKTEGEEYFRQADQVGIGGDIRFTRGSIATMLSLQGSFSGKNELLEDEVMQEETENSNGTELSGAIAITYTFSEKFSAWFDADIRYYGETELKDEQTGLPYSGQRVRYAGGWGFKKILNTHFSFTGSLQFFMMEQEPDVFLEQDLTYQGVNLGVGVTCQF